MLGRTSYKPTGGGVRGGSGARCAGDAWGVDRAGRVVGSENRASKGSGSEAFRRDAPASIAAPA